MVSPSHVRHSVQIYETDGFLAQRVVDFLHGGLSGNQRCVVVATAPHRALFMAGLEDRGVDIKAVITAGDLIVLDAQDTLDSFMVGDRPEPSRFHATVGPVLARATRDGRKVRAFGEMVDVLWRDGKPDAALLLERMWNSLAEVHRFELLCAYTMASLFKTSAGRFQEICEVHDHTHVPEGNEDENVRMLLAEVGRRANVERELREQIRALQRSEEAERLRATRLAKLQQATATLADAVSLGELSDKILLTANKLVGSVAGAVYLVDPDGRYRLCGSHNVPGISKWKILPSDASLPLAHAMTTGRALWIEKRERWLQMFGHEELLETTRTHAAIALPLVLGGRVIGGIGLSFETQRSFPDEERTWIESFAAQCTSAVERVRHYVAEHKARAEAENLLRIAESLNDMHLDLETILQRVTDEATALVGAQFGAFFYNVEDDNGDSYMLYTLSGAKKEQFSKLGMPRNTAIFAHTFNGLGVVRLDDVKKDPRYGKMAPHHGMPAGHLPVTSYLAVPVKSRTGKVIGGLFFGHEEESKFTAQHESTLRALAVTAAIAIDNAELYASAREAEDATRKTIDQLTDTVRMNELFTAVLAHDLRSPLAAVSTAAELLQLKVNEAEGRIVERILGSTRRMSRMIEQLLDFTRIRVGTGLPLETKPMDLASMLPHVIDELRVRHPSTAFAFDAIGNTLGRWDDDRLGQAFSNLIGNAAQHGVPDQGVVVFVDGSDETQVRVRVQNVGVIPPALLPQIFDPMVGGQRRRDGSRGLGIGLYITREIALAHGGSITVESNEADGTTFTLTLPREVASVEARTRVPEQAKQGPRVDAAQRMRMVVEGIRDYAIISIDHEAKIETWSPAAERITGWTREQAITQSIAMLYPDEDRSMIELDLARAAKLGATKHEGWSMRSDGTRYWADVSINVLRSGTGDLIGHALVIRDLTEQRERIAKLEENDARARLMIDSVRDYAIFMLDAEGKVASWNRGAQLTKGYTPGEIIGRSLAEFYTREDRAAGKPQKMLERATRDGRVEDEGWRVRKDGSRFWADVVITALRDENNVLRGFTKVTRDLTERRRAEEELRRSEERFRLLVDSVKDYAIFLLDPTGHVVTWNAGAERNKGYKAEEIVGEHFSKFYDPEEVRAGKCDRELEIAIRDGRFEEEGWRVRKDGSKFWANVVITPLRSANGELFGFAKVTRDLTERRTLEDERIRTIQAQEGIRLRDEFLSIVSHELKTPLAGLLLQIESAAHQSALDDATREKLIRARKSGEKLDALIETLLDVSRIATGRFVLSTERFDLAALLNETVETFQPSAAKAGCALQVETPRSLFGVWDRVRVTQVIANVMSNAIKYGAGAPVQITLEEDGNDVVLTVRDHGPGVDPTMQSKIFDRFERAVGTRHFGGLGIGLYVVREIVTAHGGKASMENSPDGGARFTIRMPMEPVA